VDLFIDILIMIEAGSVGGKGAHVDDEGKSPGHVAVRGNFAL